MTTDTYDPVSYWTERGKHYKRGLMAYMDQEDEFGLVLHGLSMVETVLEVGCGFGRMTRHIASRFPHANITAADISQEQLLRALHRVRNVAFWEKDYRDIHDHYDLVVAVEVLMHQPPDRIWADVEHLLSLSSRYFVHIDWYDKAATKREPHCFMYNFANYYREHGYACRVVDLPDIKQRIYVVEKGAS